MNKNGIYKHFKGNYYEVLGIAIDETNERLVLYRQMYEPFGFWLRPEEMFFGEKETDQGKITRFIKIGESTENVIGNIDLMCLRIRHSENEDLFRITVWNEEDGMFKVSK